MSILLLIQGGIFGNDVADFLGMWRVEGEGVYLTFLDEERVAYDSDDESFAGEGTYSFTDSTLTAAVNIDDMDMVIMYNYRFSSDSVMKVQTISQVMNGDTIQHDDEWYRVVHIDEKDDDNE